MALARKQLTKLTPKTKKQIPFFFLFFTRLNFHKLYAVKNEFDVSWLKASSTKTWGSFRA